MISNNFIKYFEYFFSFSDNSPIDNALFVQELETRDYFGAIESGPLLGEASALLDVEHEITAIQILHHEEQVALQEK